MTSHRPPRKVDDGSPRIDHLERWTTDHLASPRITHYLCVSTEEKMRGVTRINPYHLASPRITSHHLEFASFSRNTLIDLSNQIKLLLDIPNNNNNN